MNNNLPGRCTRLDRVASWLGWHIGELVGVIAPGVVALTVTPWAVIMSGAVGASWAVHEMRLAREQAESKAERGVPALEAAKSEEDVSVAGAPGDPAAGWGGAR
jgi:hypothetical protein